MYHVTDIENFECWYVSESTIGESDCFKEALEIFMEKKNEVFGSPIDGIDECIKENFGILSDDGTGGDSVNINDYGFGYTLYLQNDNDDIVIEQSFVYDPIKKEVTDLLELELNMDLLSSEERSLLSAFGIE